MSLETITITRMCPVIDYFVVLPNNIESKVTAVPVAGFVAATGGIVNRLSQASNQGRHGYRFGTQEWVELSEAIGGSNAALEAGKTLYGTNVRTDKPKPWES
jgi:hypothetical protein